MNNHLIEIIDQYLKIESNYAVLLTGEYGVGKTHFFKNELAHKIIETSLPSNNQKKYQPIHVSLFGLKSIEEIQSHIFIELYPFLKEKGVKLAIGLAKTILRGYSRLKGLGEMNDHFADLDSQKETWLNYDELVICIDDVDRKSKKLHLDEILGYINSLVENLGVKILIIAKESEFEGLTSELREKVIGTTIHFIPDTRLVFNKIIDERYLATSKLYYDFLLKNSEYILAIIEVNKNNFRNLIYFLEHFKIIFNSLEMKFQESKDFSIEKEAKQKLVLNFCLAISIEFKLGKINTTNLSNIRAFFNDELIWLSKSFESNDNPIFTSNELDSGFSYEEEFREKYFSNGQKHFFENVFSYLSGQAAFKIDDLVFELNEVYKIVDGSLAPEVVVYQKLSYTECFNLNDKEYRQLTRKMMSYVDEGKYELGQYHNIFHFATRFENFLNYNLEHLKKRFKKGIRKCLKNSRYTPQLDFYMSAHQDTEFKNEIDEIVKYCVEINNELKKKLNETENIEFFRLFRDETNKFFEKVGEYQSSFHYNPFWNTFEPKAVYQKIMKMTNNEILEMSRYFRFRYEKNRLNLSIEKQFTEEFIELLQSKKNRTKRNLKNVALNDLVNSLNTFAERKDSEPV